MTNEVDPAAADAAKTDADAAKAAAAAASRACSAWCRNVAKARGELDLHYSNILRNPAPDDKLNDTVQR